VNSSQQFSLGKLAIGQNGKLFVSDASHSVIVIYDLHTKQHQLIGDYGQSGLIDGTYKEARFNACQGICYFQRKNQNSVMCEELLYVADTGNHCIREIHLTLGTVKTIAGTGKRGLDLRGGKEGLNQDLCSPWDIVFLDDELMQDINQEGPVLLIAMAGTHQLWTYEFNTKIAKKLSGTGVESGANHQHLHLSNWAQPSGLSLNRKTKCFFVADSESSSIRKVDLVTKQSSTVVGGDWSNPKNLFAFGDKDGSLQEAKLQHPSAVLWLEGLNRLVIADTFNNKLKAIDFEKNSCQTFMLLENFQFREPTGLTYDENSGILYISGLANSHVLSYDVNQKLTCLINVN